MEKTIKPKPVKERDNKDLLELTLQLHSRMERGNKKMHDAYVEARNELEQRLEAGQHETIVMRWEKGQPPTDDDGDSLPVMGKILHNGNYHVAPVNLWNYKWHWIESGRKMSDDFTVVEWMHYPTA